MPGSSHISDVVYSNSWSAGKLFVLRLNGRTGEFETLDSVTTGGQNLNFMALNSDCTGLIGACVSSRTPHNGHIDELTGSTVPATSCTSRYRLTECSPAAQMAK